MELQGKVFEIYHLYDILVSTANWLIKQGKLKLTDCPVVIKWGSRYIINNEPKHKDGSEFKRPRELANGLWLELHGFGPYYYSILLLKKFAGFSRDDIARIDEEETT